MKYTLIKSGRVENIIECEDIAFIDKIRPQWDHIEPLDTTEEQGLPIGIGWGWNGTNFTLPVPVLPIYSNYIDIGPFFDRFGSLKMAVLTSTDAGVKALLQDIQIRKWVDLTLPSVVQGVQYLASQIPAITPALQAQILATPVQDHENLALRKLYFS